MRSFRLPAPLAAGAGFPCLIATSTESRTERHPCTGSGKRKDFVLQTARGRRSTLWCVHSAGNLWLHARVNACARRYWRPPLVAAAPLLATLPCRGDRQTSRLWCSSHSLARSFTSTCRAPRHGCGRGRGRRWEHMGETPPTAEPVAPLAAPMQRHMCWEGSTASATAPPQRTSHLCSPECGAATKDGQGANVWAAMRLGRDALAVANAHAQGRGAAGGGCLPPCPRPLNDQRTTVVRCCPRIIRATHLY